MNSVMKIMSDVARDALELPPNQRLSLARFLLDLSEAETGFHPDANEAWEEEISRRIEKIRNGTAKSIPLEEVFADLDRRFPG